MSNRVRRRGRRPKPAPCIQEPVLALDPDADVAVQICWCADDRVEEAKQQTHDMVIERLGDRRTGAVTWIVAQSVDDAHKIVDDLVDPAHGPMSDAEANYYRQCRAHLREYGGTIVVAVAPGRRE